MPGNLKSVRPGDWARDPLFVIIFSPLLRWATADPQTSQYFKIVFIAFTSHIPKQSTLWFCR
jgi:hypothetical protein